MQIIEDRRALHKIPELDRCLPKTMAYLQTALSGLKCKLLPSMDGSLCAYFDFGKARTIAFRADCDALPIREKTNTPWASTHPGQMHACGHDGHMAILLELARRLDKKEHLPHNILLVFQVAEETTGGAKELCENGIFFCYRVDAIFGLHLWPGLEKGKIYSRENELMARSCEVNVFFRGKSAHIAKATEGIDALAAATDFYRKATAMERSLPPEYFRLLKFGHLEAGTVRNAIAGHAILEGSLRAFQDEVFEGLRECLYKIGRDVERQTGCAVEISMSDGYPAVMNPPELYRAVQRIADFGELAEPSMTAEDFSWYQKELPGMFFFLGLGDTPALHAADFDFDDSILVKGADFFENLAENFL